MKTINVLWTINTLSPTIGKEFNIRSTHTISWVEAMADRLQNDKRVNLSIAAPGDIPEIKQRNINGVNYYVVPKKSSEKYWAMLLSDIHPDIIHVYGTEQSHNIDVIKTADGIPVIVSLQGLVSEYQHHYYAGIEHRTMLRYTPIRDIIRPSGFFTGKEDFIKRSKNEKKIIESVKYVEGRSTWDRVSALNINPNLKYYYCPRMIRRPFYEKEAWDISKIEKHTVFISQGNYPIKGVHFVFMAVSKLINKYPDIRIVVTGNNMFSNMTGIHRFFRTGYQRYLFDLAKSANILDRISFVGFKNADEMADLLRKIHVSIVPSSIENAPNSLAEAMMIGTPCIATFVGGNMDMLKHEKEGFLYCYNEPNMLAEYIDRIFSSDDMAKNFSVCARETALARHNPTKLVNDLLGIYTSVIEDDVLCRK